MDYSKFHSNELKGLVIRSHPYKENDIILEILFEKIGKQTVTARGVKRSKKRFFGGIEVTTCGVFQISKSKNGKSFYLDSLRSRIDLSGIRKNLFSFKASLLLIEVASKVIPESDEESSQLLPDMIKSLKYFSNENSEGEKKIILTFSLLKICKSIGVDPSEAQREFRTDDITWLKSMLATNSPYEYEPEIALDRALNQLVLFIEKSMQVSFKSKII